MTFQDLTTNSALVAALASQNINTPTPVQACAIPAILQGNDVIMQSQTGSGKTLAYLLPIYEKATPKGNQVVIVVPTRELAMQVHGVVGQLSSASGMVLKSAVIFGGVNIKTQIEKLKEKPEIIIGTVDRIHELIQKKKITAHTVKMFIVDEADKLVEKQNAIHLKNLRKCFMRDTQNIFVSATFAQRSIAQIKEIAPKANLIQTATQERVPETIAHYYIVSEQRDKLEYLRKLIGIMKPQKSLIFLNDLDEIHRSVEKLKYHNLNAVTVNSDSSKQERQSALKSFSSGSVPYLVSTDLAARGIDVSDINCVYHVSIAENPSDYVHRAGRTGRNGTSGISLSIITKQELQWIQKYENRYHITIPEIKMHSGKITTTDSNNAITVLY